MSRDLVVWTILLLMILPVPLAGWFSGHSGKGEWLSAGRRLSLPAFVATLVCTWYGGILGVGEFAWSWGLVNWLALGAFYYVFALLYAWLLAGRIRETQALSLPQLVGESQGAVAGKMAAVYTLLMVNPAPYLLMTALIVSHALGLSLGVSLVASLPLALVYVWRGGFGSVVATDRIQFLMMFTSFGLALIWLVTQVGDPAWLKEQLPEAHLQIPGTLGWNTVLAWGLVALWTLVDPGFHQRVAAARDTQTARRGILLSVLFWFVFDGMTTLCGLYARALIPDLEIPAEAFLQLGSHFPAWLEGLFLGGLAATVLSTLDSYFLLSGSTFSRDLLGRGDNDNAMKQGMLLMSFVALLLAWLLPSIVQMWLIFASLGVPVLLPALLASLGRGVRRRILPAMLAAGLVSSLWLIAGLFKLEYGWPVYPFGLEPMFPGLFAALVAWLLTPKSIH
jgi:SSS family solute:Na+ symporter